MNLKSLECFVKVVQLGSYTLAAEKLHIQRSHLSRVINQFEQSLGIRLLDRSTRVVALTEMGKNIYYHALDILQSVDDAYSVIENAKDKVQGTLRITCGYDFGTIAVGDWVRKFLIRYPEIKVNSEFSNRIQNILEDGFDLAIRLGSLPDSSLAARKLGELSYGLFASPAYLASRGNPLTPRQLVDHSVLTFASGKHNALLSLHRNQHTEEIQLVSRLQGNNIFVIKDAAIDGLGIAKLPCLLVQSALERGDLIPVLTHWSLAQVPIYAVFSGNRNLPPKVRAFIDLAVEEMDKLDQS